MSTVYFGNTTIGANSGTGFNGIADGNVGQQFTCPGVGSVQVVEISLYCSSAIAPDPQEFRCAIYSLDLSTLICQGASTISVTNASPAWQGHVGAASITPNPAFLVGGTKYTLVFSPSNLLGGSLSLSWDVGSAGDWKFTSNDYSGGFPASITLGSNSSLLVNIRAGVNVVSGSQSNQFLSLLGVGR